MKKNVDKKITWWYYSQARYERRVTERCPSGLWCRSWKPVWLVPPWVRIPPSPLYITYSDWQLLGEVPKWLKGLPWKGSRSLIAARGFKSLLLRFKTSLKTFKKVLKKLLTTPEKSVNILFASKKHRRCQQDKKQKSLKSCWQAKTNVIKWCGCQTRAGDNKIKSCWQVNIDMIY